MSHYFCVTRISDIFLKCNEWRRNLRSVANEHRFHDSRLVHRSASFLSTGLINYSCSARHKVSVKMSTLRDSNNSWRRQWGIMVCSDWKTNIVIIRIVPPVTTRGPFFWHGLTLIPAWIRNHKPSKVWDEITNPFPNFNGCIIEVWEWINNFIPYFTMDVITCPCWD